MHHIQQSIQNSKRVHIIRVGRVSPLVRKNLHFWLLIHKNQTETGSNFQNWNRILFFKELNPELKPKCMYTIFSFLQWQKECLRLIIHNFECVGRGTHMRGFTHLKSHNMNEGVNRPSELVIEDLWSPLHTSLLHKDFFRKNWTHNGLNWV